MNSWPRSPLLCGAVRTNPPWTPLDTSPAISFTALVVVLVVMLAVGGLWLLVVPAMYMGLGTRGALQGCLYELRWYPAVPLHRADAIEVLSSRPFEGTSA